MDQVPTHQPRLSKTFPRLLLAASIGTLIAGAAIAQDVTIPKKEWEQMKREMSQMRSELNQLKAHPPATRETASAGNSSAVAALSQRVDELTSLTSPGESKFHLAGSASATFISPNRDNSNFEATFSPILLWHLNDRMLFEAEVEFELEGHDTETKLEFAALDYSLTDNLTLVAGKFLNPMNIFVERFESKWINRLPDTPLAIYDGILPESNVGFELRGAFPIGQMSKINFAAYVSNAPSLVTDDEEAAGTLDFDNWSSSHDNKAVGGRLGFQFCPNFEIGYGVQYARVRGDEGGQSVGALQQSVDLLAFAEFGKGRWTLWSQYAWSNVGNRDYDVLATEDDATGELVSGPRFSNHRNGGYVQVSYRGKEWDSALMNRLEFILRADQINQPNNAPGSFDEKRFTFGVDYWLTSYTALKAAYEIDDRDGDRNHNSFLIGIATGL
jgi:hypothetical protein